MTNHETNYEYAVEFEAQILTEMLNIADNSTKKEYIEHLFKNYIYIIPFQDENQIIRMNISSQYPDEYNGISQKLSNVQLDLKNAILTAFEFALGAGIPETKNQLIKLALLALLKLYILSTVKLSNNECLLLLYLHEKDAYNTPVPEEAILNSIYRGELKMSQNEYDIAIKNLTRIASVIIIDGKVSLNEKIILKYN